MHMFVLPAVSWRFQRLCKNIENELRVYLSRRVAFKLPKLDFLLVVFTLRHRRDAGGR